MSNYKNGRVCLTQKIINYSEDVRCRLLSLIEGGNWEYTELYGCVQREWQGFYYDSDSVNREELRRIESDYFNLGTEWHCRVEGDEEELAMRVYCYEWDDDKIREEIASKCGREKVKMKSN